MNFNPNVNSYGDDRNGGTYNNRYVDRYSDRYGGQQYRGQQSGWRNRASTSPRDGNNRTSSVSANGITQMRDAKEISDVTEQSCTLSDEMMLYVSLFGTRTKALFDTGSFANLVDKSWLHKINADVKLRQPSFTSVVATSVRCMVFLMHIYTEM